MAPGVIRSLLWFLAKQLTYVPELNFFPVAGNQRLAVCADSHRGEAVPFFLESLESDECLSRGHVPQLHRSINISSDKHFAIGRESNAFNMTGMPFEGGHLFP